MGNWAIISKWHHSQNGTYQETICKFFRWRTITEACEKCYWNKHWWNSRSPYILGCIPCKSGGIKLRHSLWYIRLNLLPLFEEEAKSVAMILHAMNTVKSSTEFLHPAQIPVISCDQPLYAIAKKGPMEWPETYGEKKYVTVHGGLHIEMAA